MSDQSPAIVGEGVAKRQSVSRTSSKAQKEIKNVEIPALELQTMKLRLVGDSPLLCHAWSDKAKKMMLDKQMKVATGGKEAKDPYRDFADSLYWLTKKPDTVTPDDIAKAKFGFPTIGFKAAAVDACTFVDGTTKVEARGAFHIVGQMVEIEGTPEIDERMVRIAMGTADIRYRGRFDSWAVELLIRYNLRALSAAQIVNLFNVAGFAVGVGEHRPQKDGSLGMFHVE